MRWTWTLVNYVFQTASRITGRTVCSVTCANSWRTRPPLVGKASSTSKASAASSIFAGATTDPTAGRSLKLSKFSKLSVDIFQLEQFCYRNVTDLYRWTWCWQNTLNPLKWFATFQDLAGHIQLVADRPQGHPQSPSAKSGSLKISWISMDLLRSPAGLELPPSRGIFNFDSHINYIVLIVINIRFY